MSDKTSLGTRMKENYEMRSRQYLTRRMPTIIRLDGKAFHTYTKGLNKPFDEGLIEDMQLTTAFLCSEIQGVKCGYTQSDEITLLLTDYDTLETSAWFDYNVQKMCSVAASLATAKFNQLRTVRFFRETGLSVEGYADKDVMGITLAFFDARVFQIPEKDEVLNCFIWRQRDAEKNSVAMLAQSLYSQKELHKKNGSDMQEMCWQKGQNWNDLHFSKKRGSLITKVTYINGKTELGDNKEPKIGDLWYQPNVQSTFFPDKRGRLLTWANVPSAGDDSWPDWCDTKIESIRTKWEVIDTPIFSQSREIILNLL